MESDNYGIHKKYIDDFIKDEYPIRISENKIIEFIKKTDGIGVSKAERVLKLAFNLEYEELEKGWEDLKLLYEFALSNCLDDEKIDYYIDWIVSSLKWQNSYWTSSTENRIKIADECLIKLKEVYQLAPQSPSINHLFGIFYYEHPQSTLNNIEFSEKALQYFKRAFKFDAEKYISCFFIAHCYHDLKKWEKAYEYYTKIDKEKFISKNPEWTWRIWKLEEQILFCSAKLGNIDECKHRLDEFIKKVTSLNDDEFFEFIMNFDEAMETIKIIDDNALKNRLFNLIKDKGFEKRYEEELENY